MEGGCASGEEAAKEILQDLGVISKLMQETLQCNVSKTKIPTL